MKIKDHASNPYRWVKRNSQTNGQDDQDAKRILKTLLYKATLPDSSHLPNDYREVWVRERMFLCSYNNIYIVYEAVLADDEVEGFSTLVPARCTSHGDYLDVGQSVDMAAVTIRDPYIYAARAEAMSFLSLRQSEILSHENWLN